MSEHSVNIKKSSGDVWRTLVYNNLIEYIDCSEIENYTIQMYPNSKNSWKSDFCEIHPSMIHGVMGGMIPFPDHSQSPRNLYQCSMGKQAIGIYALSYQTRTAKAGPCTRQTR